MSKTSPPKATIEALRTMGLTRQDIADQFGVSLPTVKAWIRKYGIAAPERKRKPKKDPFIGAAVEMGTLLPRDRRSQKIIPLGENVSLMDRCKQVLGKRMSEDHRGYVLDGRPASSIQVANAAGIPLVARVGKA